MSKVHRDAIYTPAWLADALAETLPAGLSGVVFDPAAGEGALLAAVEKRFGAAVTVAAADIDREAVGALRRRHPSWVVSHTDFLSAASRRASRAWNLVTSELSLVVINPPFSFRGGSGVWVNYAGQSYRATPALQFLITAIDRLNPAYGFLAVVPLGALEAERNSRLWRSIERDFDVLRLHSPSTSAFTGSRVATSVVSLRRRVTERPDEFEEHGANGELDEISSCKDGECRCIEIVRGRVPVHRARQFPTASPAKAPFFHTTTLSRPTTIFGPGQLSDEGPFVLIARVGAWRAPSVMTSGRAILSDCLIGFRPLDNRQLGAVLEALEAKEQELRGLYTGTGARYITLAKVSTFLESCGWRVRVVQAGAHRGAPCSEHEETVLPVLA